MSTDTVQNQKEVIKQNKKDALKFFGIVIALLVPVAIGGYAIQTGGDLSWSRFQQQINGEDSVAEAALGNLTGGFILSDAEFATVAATLPITQVTNNDVGTICPDPVAIRNLTAIKYDHLPTDNLVASLVKFDDSIVGENWSVYAYGADYTVGGGELYVVSPKDIASLLIATNLDDGTELMAIVSPNDDVNNPVVFVSWESTAFAKLNMIPVVSSNSAEITPVFYALAQSSEKFAPMVEAVKNGDTETWAALSQEIIQEIIVKVKMMNGADLSELMNEYAGQTEEAPVEETTANL